MTWLKIESDSKKICDKITQTNNMFISSFKTKDKFDTVEYIPEFAMRIYI